MSSAHPVEKAKFQNVPSAVPRFAALRVLYVQSVAVMPPPNAQMLPLTSIC